LIYINLSMTSLVNHKRVKWMISTIADSFRIREEIVEEAIKVEENGKLLEEFFSANGPDRILAYY
jgi:hypothetical protein